MNKEEVEGSGAVDSDLDCGGYKSYWWLCQWEYVAMDRGLRVYMRE